MITDFDRHASSRPWMWAAQQAKKRIVTAVHGSPARATYLPVLADEVLAWGSSQELWFNRHAPDKRIHVVGRWDIQERRPINPDIDRIVICHSREQLHDYERQALHTLVQMARDAKIEVVIRAHPSVQHDLGPSWSACASLCTVVQSRGVPLALFLQKNDLVVGVTSTALVEAVLAGHAVAVFSDESRPLPADLEDIEVMTRRNPVDVRAGRISEEHARELGQLSEQMVRHTGPTALNRTRAAIGPASDV
ncbi:hypothetical protein [Microbacterium sp. SS28]|uniref:hypothetical protein n=1 Tax=Microbacterium sp. SS28 TaxID=2919948 RepID=UPI001FAB18F3|nr:hypothetical protein [Microbacterium sp. SS28]